MVNVTDTEFEKMLGKAIDALPEKYAARLSNVVITYDDFPSTTQMQKLGLHSKWQLFGLYEGVPQTVRGAGVPGSIPDKITIYRQPLQAVSSDAPDLAKRVKKTLWHEVAHHFGLGHNEIAERE